MAIHEEDLPGDILIFLTGAPTPHSCAHGARSQSGGDTVRQGKGVAYMYGARAHGSCKTAAHLFAGLEWATTYLLSSLD